MNIVYYYAKVDRRNFGDLMSEEGLSHLDILSSFETDVLKIQDSNAVLAVWSLAPKRATQLPEVLICQDGTQNDWTAWITTFAAKIRPFSAYIRLMTNSDFQRITKRPSTPDLGSSAWSVAGLILGEVLGASGLPDKALETLSARVFMSTLSFAMYRAAAMYPDFHEWGQLVDMWESVRKVTKQRTRSVEGAAVARVCATVMTALDFQGASKILTPNDMQVCEACRSLIMSRQRIPSGFSGIKPFADAELRMHGSREDRVLAFQEFVEKSGNLAKPEEVSFMLGYLASRIAPGTIRHSSVLEHIAHRYPTAMLWYGFCSGFAEGDNISDNSGRRVIDLPSSARRVIRELLRAEPVLGVPVCDIGYSELIALSRTGGDPLEGLIRTTQGAVIVELLPGVCTSMGVFSNKPTDSQTLELREREIIEKMGEYIDRLHDTYKSLHASRPVGSSAKQRTLFSHRRKKQ